MAKRRTGINPLSYLGVAAPCPPNVVYKTRSPVNPYDWHGFSVGDFWIVKDPQELWFLASLENEDRAQNTSVSLWIKIYPDSGSGSGGAEDFPTDVGTATEAAGVLNVLGGTNINTTGAGDTLTIALNNSITLAGDLSVDGPVKTSGITPGIVQADNVGVWSASQGNDGELLIGVTGANPSWNTITSSDNSVFITNGPGTIDLIAVGEGGGIVTVETDNGDVTQNAGIINVLGGTNINTTGVGNTVTVNLNNSITLNNGLDLSGDLTLTGVTDGVLQADGVGVISASRGTDGQVLIGQTGANPVWGNITSTDGSITINNGPHSIDLIAVGGGGDRGEHVFSAYKTTNEIYNNVPAQNKIIICDTELIDDGNNYDHTTGVYTAPEAGVYYFYASLSAVYFDLGVTPQNAPFAFALYIGTVAYAISCTNPPIYSISSVTPPNPSYQLINPYTVNGSIVIELKALEEVRTYFIGGRFGGNYNIAINGSPSSLKTSICGYKIR